MRKWVKKASIATAAAVLALSSFAPDAASAADSAGPATLVVSKVPTDGLAPVTVNSPADLKPYQIAARVPAGGHLAPALPAPGPAFSGGVVVKDAGGRVVGAYDEPFAIDAKGHLVHGAYQISDGNLVQTVLPAADTAFPLTVLFSDYTPVTRGTGGPALAAAFVSVPSNYIYNPSLGSLHDYCTSSPDSFLSADFRGPCARHDLCYEAPGNHKTACDNALWSDLVSNCDFAYSAANPLRYTCEATADIYWAAVTLFGGDS